MRPSESDPPPNARHFSRVLIESGYILNTVRIALMAQSYSMYDFWHNGTRVPIVSFTMLAVTLGICLCGLKFAEGR
jgi:hypothetical protein